MRGPNYQLMRNLLFAASFAESERKGIFGVPTIVPERYSAGLRQKVTAFQDEVLLPAFRDRIGFVDYESYALLLYDEGREDARELSEFLLRRIAAVSPK